MNSVIYSIWQLENAGFSVTPAERIPGLWNVEGLGRDVTTNQLHALAAQHGSIFNPHGSIVKVGNTA